MTDKLMCKALRLLLEKDEWSVRLVDGIRVIHHCPHCGREKDVGHKKTCEWKNTIEELKREKRMKN